jgi:glutamyl-tRNA synthetase
MIGGHSFLFPADDSVAVELVGGEDVPTASFAKEIPCHKKNPSLGNKKVYYSNKLFVEQDDARTFKEGEEVK